MEITYLTWAIANYSSDSVSILIGDGTGNFLDRTDLSVVNSPHSIVTGDFNGDNVLDLVTANNVSNNVSILIGLTEPNTP